MVRRLLVMGAGTLVAAMLLAACGGSSSKSTGTTSATKSTSKSPATTAAAKSSGGASKIDGCKVVTAADAQAILGEPVKEFTGGTKPMQMAGSCSWEVEDSMKLLQFHVYDGAMFYAPETYQSQPGFEQLNGLGEKAFGYGNLGYGLEILEGTRMISLDASGFKPNDPGFDHAKVRQSMIDLAGKVVGQV